MGEPTGTCISALIPNVTRHRHARWHGDVISTKEARKRRNGTYDKSDPYRCKCSFIPYLSDNPKNASNEVKFKEQKEAMKKQEKALDKKAS
jgi:hypothetical protein